MLFVITIVSVVSFNCQVVLAKDLSLATAVEEAFASSPRIQKAHSFYSEASWKRVESYSGFLPTLNASANYLTNKKYVFLDIALPPSPNTISIPQVVPTSSLLITAQLPIFDGLANLDRVDAARYFEKSAEADLDWTKFQVETDITLQFYKALGAKLLKEVAEQNVTALDDHLKDVNLFKRAGLSTKVDVLRVDVQVSEAKSELLNSIDNMETARNRLAEILGHEIETREIKGQLPVLRPEFIKNVSLVSSTTRKDIQSLTEKEEAFDYLESASGKYWVPKLSVFGQYQYYNNRSDSISNFDEYRDSYLVGLSLSWNIFDGLVSYSRSKESVEEKYQADKNKQMSWLKAKQDFEYWKRKYVYFCSVYSSRLNEVEKASESVRLAREGRKVGSQTNTDLLDTESELFRSKAGVVNAQIGAVEAMINLELATGQRIYRFY